MSTAKLSPTMETALVLASEQGSLIRQDGGFWTPPGEPMGLMGPVTRGRWVRTQTIHALRDRGLLSGKGWNEPARLVSTEVVARGVSVWMLSDGDSCVCCEGRHVFNRHIAFPAGEISQYEHLNDVVIFVTNALREFPHGTPVEIVVRAAGEGE